jgi:hypothetical protein
MFLINRDAFGKHRSISSGNIEYAYEYNFDDWKYTCLNDNSRVTRKNVDPFFIASKIPEQIQELKWTACSERGEGDDDQVAARCRNLTECTRDNVNLGTISQLAEHDVPIIVLFLSLELQFCSENIRFKHTNPNGLGNLRLGGNYLHEIPSENSNYSLILDLHLPIKC